MGDAVVGGMAVPAPGAPGPIVVEAPFTEPLTVSRLLVRSFQQTHTKPTPPGGPYAVQLSMTSPTVEAPSVAVTTSVWV